MASKTPRKIKRLNPPTRKEVKIRYTGVKGLEVKIAGSFNNWIPVAMKYNARCNAYCATMMLEPGEYEYKFIVDGTWVEDFNSKDTVANDFGTINSVLHVE